MKVGGLRRLVVRLSSATADRVEAACFPTRRWSFMVELVGVTDPLESVAGQPCVPPTNMPQVEGQAAVSATRPGPAPTELAITDLVVGTGDEVTEASTVTDQLPHRRLLDRPAVGLDVGPRRSRCRCQFSAAADGCRGGHDGHARGRSTSRWSFRPTRPTAPTLRPDRPIATRRDTDLRGRELVDVETLPSPARLTHRFDACPRPE